jgi:hypothetical protein
MECLKNIKKLYIFLSTKFYFIAFHISITGKAKMNRNHKQLPLHVMKNRHVVIALIAPTDWLYTNVRNYGSLSAVRGEQTNL